MRKLRRRGTKQIVWFGLRIESGPLWPEPALFSDHDFILPLLQGSLQKYVGAKEEKEENSHL